MNKKDIKTLVIFIILIIANGLLFGYNFYINHNKKDVDRKVNYIFKNYTYQTVLQEGIELFFNTIDILNTNKYSYELNNDDSIKNYIINDEMYKRILNFNKAINTLNKNDLDKYMSEKEIIVDNNYYFIKNRVDDYNKDYIGSSIDYLNTEGEIINFTANNYYCEDYKYIGNIIDIPNCNYQIKTTNFKVIFENNKFKIFNYEDIENIIK